MDRMSLLTMALSLATLDAITALGVASVRLKWPNDLVVPDPFDGPRVEDRGYRKIGGLLAEFVDSPLYGPSVLLGLGLNINWGSMPGSLAETAVSLDELTGGVVDRWDLVERIVKNFDTRWLTAVEAGDTASLIEHYSSSSATIGSVVRVELPAGELFGVATGVTPIGALVVESDGRRHVLTAGDVIHLRPVGHDQPDLTTTSPGRPAGRRRRRSQP